MRTGRRYALAALLLPVVLVSGCKSTGRALGGAKPSHGSSAAAHAIPVGAGPQAHYAVRAQPSAGSCHYRYEHSEPLPDRKCTPGATSPAVTQANLSSTICRRGGYTGGVRPSSYVTGKEKTANARSYGYTGLFKDAEYDHLISLQLGGDPDDPRNLWVEAPDPGHRRDSGPNNNKDKVETKLHTAVCKGSISLHQAQYAIATDWTTALADLHLQ
jgi:hypothetical protein